MKTISFFNNKGGVGKTTLTCNLAFTFAKDFGKRVLIIDCDPQCNSTILILGEEASYNLYSNDQNSTHKTILNILAPFEDGDSSINTDHSPFPAVDNRFCVDLIPGHPRLSIIEERLTQSWRDGTAGEIEGIRRTNWAKLLVDHYANDYDLILFDLGPSLGTINRSCLIGSDYFIAPMGADIFSMIGLRNISEWLTGWLNEYDIAIRNCENKYPGRIKRFKLSSSPKIKTGFAGYTVQAYIAKYTGGERRPTKAFENVIKNFPREVKKNLEFFANKGTKFKLGEIPNMFSLIPLAQAVNSPIGGLTSSDGLVGTHYTQAKRYQEILKSTAKQILKNIGV